MKSLIKVLTGILILTGITQAAPEWVAISDTDCINHGGKITNGTCNANLEDAKSICQSVGATLPTIGNLKDAITNCGGILENTQSNWNNSAYQRCYSKRGFSPDLYWSGTAVSNDNSQVWYVNFYSGCTFNYHNPQVHTNIRVRCVKSK